MKSAPLEIKDYVFREKFTSTPGGRYRRHSYFSGEQFREEVLRPALRGGVGLRIDMTDVLGISHSFLDESFGTIVREIGLPAFRAYFTIFSLSSKSLDRDIEEVLADAQ